MKEDIKNYKKICITYNKKEWNKIDNLYNNNYNKTGNCYRYIIQS